MRQVKWFAIALLAVLAVAPPSFAGGRKRQQFACQNGSCSQQTTTTWTYTQQPAPVYYYYYVPAPAVTVPQAPACTSGDCQEQSITFTFTRKK